MPACPLRVRHALGPLLALGAAGCVETPTTDFGEAHVTVTPSSAELVVGDSVRLDVGLSRPGPVPAVRVRANAPGIVGVDSLTPPGGPLWVRALAPGRAVLSAETLTHPVTVATVDIVIRAPGR
jgi:hypothetical protein